MDELVLVERGEPQPRRERRERVRGELGARCPQLGATPGEARRGLPDRRVVVAGDRGVGALRVARRRPGGGRREVLGREPQQRRRVARLVGAAGGEHVAVDHVAVAGVVDDLRERGAAEPDAAPGAVRVAPAAEERAPLEAEREPAQVSERVGGGAAGRAGADRGPGAPDRVGRRPAPRVEAVDGERGVEHDRAHAGRMADGERLREVRAVGVAVDAHDRHAELVEHRGEVVRGGARPVGVRCRAELPRAAADVARVVALAGLQAPAVDRARAAGAAVVDQDQVVPARERPEHEAVVGAGVDRAVARAALGGDDRHDRRTRPVRARVHAVPHRDPGPVRVGPMQRHADRAAPGRAIPGARRRPRGGRRRGEQRDGDGCGGEAPARAHEARHPIGRPAPDPGASKAGATRRAERRAPGSRQASSGATRDGIAARQGAGAMREPSDARRDPDASGRQPRVERERGAAGRERRGRAVGQRRQGRHRDRAEALDRRPVRAGHRVRRRGPGRDHHAARPSARPRAPPRA